MRYQGQKERGTEEMHAQVKDAAEEKVLLRSQRTLQSYCLLPRDTWQQLRLESTLEHTRQENKEIQVCMLCPPVYLSGDKNMETTPRLCGA